MTMAEEQYTGEGDQQYPYQAVIVDNSDFSRRQMADILTGLGIRNVGELTSVREALKVIAKTNANIVILDILMPDSSGIELIKKFHAFHDEKFFIIVSALRSKRIIIEAIKSGAVDFLSRPLNRELFIQSMLQVKQKIDKNRPALQNKQRPQ